MTTTGVVTDVGGTVRFSDMNLKAVGLLPSSRLFRSAEQTGEPLPNPGALVPLGKIFTPAWLFQKLLSHYHCLLDRYNMQ